MRTWTASSGSATNCLPAARPVSKRHVQINISVSTFVPKPHTPFQWFGQAPLDEIRRKQAYLAKGLRKRGINLKLHDPKTSLLEGAFARGDRSLGTGDRGSGRKGLQVRRLERSASTFARWKEAFADCGIDLDAYAGRTFPLDQPLPWDHVQSGVTKKFLQRGVRAGRCRGTDRQLQDRMQRIAASVAGTAERRVRERRGPRGGAQAGQRSKNAPLLPEMTARVRMRYTKTGRVRFLSHLDFMTLFHRSCLRAGIPVAFSQGFNPHPKIAFGPALSVGIESEAEYLDLETDPFVGCAGRSKSG